MYDINDKLDKNIIIINIRANTTRKMLSAPLGKPEATLQLQTDCIT